MASFANQAGIDVTHVPFKSTAEAANSLIGGDTQALIVPTLGSQAFVDNPSLRLLAAVSKTRLPLMPNVPTVDESGLAGFEFQSWFGLLGPAEMPAAVTEKINAAVAKSLTNPSVAAQIRQQGVEPRAMSPADFTQVLQRSRKSIGEIVASIGLTSK